MSFRATGSALVALFLLLAPVPARAQGEAVRAQAFTYTFGVDYFVQASSRQSFAFEDERFNDNETFMWERLRPKISGTNGRVSFLVEGQDTHSRGSEYVVRKAWLDLLNAYVDIKVPNGFALRVGRRQGDFDAIPRLVRTPDFAAVVRSFDLVELRWQRRKTEARAFAFRTVDNLPDRFNTWKRGERLWTVFARQGLGAHEVQTYVTTRLNTDAVSETGVRGNGTVYGWEVQATGPTGLRHLEYSLEHVLERGNTSTDRVRANGLFASLTATPTPNHEMELRYLRTSGDATPGDGVKGTYDPFYMAIGQLSPLGLMRGPNLNSVSIGGTHRVLPKFTAIWRVHEHRLNTLTDGWYSTRTLRRPSATSPRLGTELDMLLTYTVSPRLSARIGYFRLRPGAYLTGSGPSGSPYEVRVQIFGGL